MVLQARRYCGAQSWLKVSLRTLLLAITALSVWLAVETNNARQRRHAIVEIQNRGGHIMYADEWEMFSGGDIPKQHRTSLPVAVQWLRDMLGKEYFVRISGVGVMTAGDDLAFLNMVPHLSSLSIERSAVTDDGLVGIENQTDLIYLWLDDTQVGDKGLDHLRKMKNLKYLYIRNSLVTDVGITQLKKRLPHARICYGNELEHKIQ